MRTHGEAIDVSHFLDDRLDDGVFRIDRQAYWDADVYEAEMDIMFESSWVFLCHESQIEKDFDYYATHIGRQPVYVHRQKGGGIKGFINACSHRAAILTPFKQGTARVLTCRFHGWAYGCDGKCVKVKNEETGWGDGLDKGQLDLKELPRCESYRGFVFGALTDRVPPLADYLGGAAAFIDMFADQSPEGVEILPGSQTYVCDHNWKLQAENVTDGYHVSTVHRNFMDTMVQREARDGTEGLLKTETGRIKGDVKNGMYDLGNGHMAIWADRASPEAAPLFPATERIEKEFDAVKAHWMLKRGRNLLVFPNLVLNDLASTHIRTHRPLSPTRCEVTIWCIAPKGEPAEARAARLRKFEDFFLVTGLATSDDVVSLDTAQEGCYGPAGKWNEFERGLTTITQGPDEEANKLGITPVSSHASWDNEGVYIGWYRHWRDLLAAGGLDDGSRVAQAAE